MSEELNDHEEPSDSGGERGWHIWPRDCAIEDRFYTLVDGKQDSNFLSDISQDRLFCDAAENFVTANVYTSAGWGRMSTSGEELENMPGNKSLLIQSLDDLENHLDALKLDTPAQTISYFIDPVYSWGRLQVSEEVARRLFSSLPVHQQFISVISTFGEKISPVEQSYLTYFDRIQILNPFRTFRSTDSAIFTQTCGYDLGYLYKYVDLHGRERPKDPFSIRQTGVYHKYDPQAKRSVWIFIQPSESLKERLDSLFSRYKDNPIDIALQVEVHFLVLTHAAKNWRPYITYLEDTFSKITEKGFYSSLDLDVDSSSPKIDFGDVREIHIFMDKLRTVLQLIQMDYQIAKKVQQLLRRLRNRWIQETALNILTPRLEDVYDRFEQHLYDLSGHESRLNTLLMRANDISRLIQQVIDYRAGQFSQAANNKLNSLVSSTVVQGESIHSLARKGAKDTKLMKLFTIFTVIFLPGIFIASIFATNFFAFSTESNHIIVASNIWIYFLISCTITCSLTTGWIIYKHIKRRSRLRAERDGNGAANSRKVEEKV
ncbi:hypothetical protein TWF102_009747 [Orbilia oligospora]|uniref:CorA-like transporter domain-containing protein n=1 Tax=Orbilia oligospora TaxID=2813651 RepID=A0A7C8K269_ORBOL|nr:hypothetical protein TWF103_003688 [Orbilia oligospora]KAF3089256.1 hypothetical protein TWF102_009747 [Orbilia oligospora]KAF3126726.1 hypothetical protein TWF594_000859 [Orbilia oligospora]KAF3146661.1 hypothetical protein TWF703_003932 [Orbilia oligospora]